jgi:hypothetical protein
MSTRSATVPSRRGRGSKASGKPAFDPPTSAARERASRREGPTSHTRIDDRPSRHDVLPLRHCDRPRRRSDGTPQRTGHEDFTDALAALLDKTAARHTADLRRAGRQRRPAVRPGQGTRDPVRRARQLPGRHPDHLVPAARAAHGRLLLGDLAVGTTQLGSTSPGGVSGRTRVHRPRGPARHPIHQRQLQDGKEAT